MQSTFERHGFFVSRETLDKLETYDALLRKWQKAINLVGPTTLDVAAERHFYDSAQVFRYIPDIDVTLADLGSGAGFPGLVLAMLGVRDVHLVESDIRKATFLREVSRETSTPVTVHDRRIEETAIPNVSVVTARALAPLKDLIGHLARLQTLGHPIYGVFAKGLQHGEEIDQARKEWDFDLEVFASESDMAGKLLRVKNVVKRAA
ncbi:MAG TPA: 16S rRNA (guanine(527)-N(7))-methyltransferase RsmG [Patescibacteria group bacterium]|nr:16S rRNA (guanine(527)-N(7))-methyltransferase RsmG [Patescibacteria group bacterium]